MDINIKLINKEILERYQRILDVWQLIHINNLDCLLRN